MVIEEVTVDELAEALATGARLVDVREPSEFAAFHVPGARLVPLGSVSECLDMFDGEGPTYVICRTGSRSMRACELLADAGFAAINVAGGSMAWELSGRPTEAGAAADA